MTELKAVMTIIKIAPSAKLLPFTRIYYIPKFSFVNKKCKKLTIVIYDPDKSKKRAKMTLLTKLRELRLQNMAMRGDYKTMTPPNNTKAHPDYGESEAKTINNRFHRSDVSRCEWSERGLPREATRHKSRRERTRRTSQRFLAGGRPYPLQKRKTSLIRLAFFGADYGARTRHLHLGKVALYQMS